MESILGVVQSPLFLTMIVFLGAVSLGRVLLVRGSDLKRTTDGDRRRTSRKAVEFPLHDSEGELVTADRRVQADRRRSCLLAIQQEMKQQDSVAG